MSARRILDEQREYESRVISEYESALACAQAALRTPRLVDEASIAFAEGQTVENLRELWRTDGASMSMIVAGSRGVLTQINATNVAVVFEGNPKPYWIRREQVKVALRVVAGVAA